MLTDDFHPSAASAEDKSGARIQATTYLFWSALAFASLAIVNVCLSYICEAIPHLDHSPYTTVWFQEYFPDLLLFKSRFDYFHSESFFTYTGSTPFMYPAPDAVLYKALYLVFGRHPVIGFLTLSITSYLVAGLSFIRGLVRRGVTPLIATTFTIVTLFSCYPIGFELKQANIEIAIWVLLAVGMACFMEGWSLSAALCFAVAASMKIYPVVFFGLLLHKKKYKEIVAGVCAVLFLTLVALWLVCPSISQAYKGIGSGLQMFRDSYMLQVRSESGMDHSLFGLLKALWRPTPSFEQLKVALPIYLSLIASSGVILFFVRIRHLPVWNQITCLVVASVLFPPTSFEYTLQHLLIPFSMLLLYLLDEGAWSGHKSVIRVYLLFFIVCLGWMSQVIHNNERWDGPIKAAVLLALFVLAVAKPLTGSPLKPTEA